MESNIVKMIVKFNCESLFSWLIKWNIIRNIKIIRNNNGPAKPIEGIGEIHNLYF